LHGLITSGQWPVDCRWSPFVRPTGTFLEVVLSHSVLTVSQVKDPTKQPRDVHFRRNMRMSRQGWFAGFPKPKSDDSTQGLPHLLMLHGHQSLDFCHLAVPSPKHQQGFVYRSSNLMLLPHLVAPVGPPTEDTDHEAVMTLKEEIDKWRKDHGG
jgi:hypothetical protein